MKSTSNATLIAKLTLLWAIVIPSGLFVLLRVFKWPIDLTFVIGIPLTVPWVIGGYPLIIAANERYRRHEGVALPLSTIADLAFIGVCSGGLSLATMFSYLCSRARSYIATVVFVLIAFALVYVIMRLFRRVLNHI